MSAYDTIELLRNITGFSIQKQRINHFRESSLVNLNSELNSLINIMGYQHKEGNIKKLLEIIFSDLLQMQEISRYPNTQIIDFMDALIKINRDHILDSSILELHEIQQVLWFKYPYVYRCKEGINGYWRFIITENKDSTFYVEPRLFGSQFYYGIYW